MASMTFGLGYPDIGVPSLNGKPPIKPTNAIPDLIRQEVWNGSLYGPTGENLSAETAEIRRRYREMLRSPWVKVGVLSKVWDVAALDLSVPPYDPENDRDKLIAEFHADNLRSCKGGIRAIVEASLFGPLMDGYGLCHRKSAPAERGRWAQKLMMTELRPKDSDYYRVTFDRYRNPLYVQEKWREPEDPERLPMSEFVFIRHLQIFDSQYGMSDLRSADQAYCCLDAARKLRMIYLDKYTGPFLEGAYENPDIKGSLLRELMEARAGGAVTYPKGTEVKITEMAMGGQEAFSKAESDLKEEIVTSIAGAFLQMMGGQQGVQRGSSAEHATSAKLFRWYLAQLVCDAINDQIIPYYTDVNFSGSPAFPKASLSGVDAAQILADLEVGAILKANAVPTSYTEWYRRSGWAPPKDRTDAVGGVMPGDPPVDPFAVDPNALPGEPPNPQLTGAA